MEDPIYFELSWSILSSICIFLVLVTLMTMAIFGYSKILAVPLIVSINGALANGLCYYAYYSTAYPLNGQRVAAAFADVFWGVQELGMSAYSYIILSALLTGMNRNIYLAAYWVTFLAGFAIRFAILVCRQQVLGGDNSKIDLVSKLHIGFFLSIMLVEFINAGFLLTKVKFTGQTKTVKNPILDVVAQSSEVRLAALFFIGLARCITYSSQSTAQSANSAVGELDRFIYALECLYPFVMIFDQLVTKATSQGSTPHASSKSRDGLRSKNAMSNERLAVKKVAKPSDGAESKGVDE